MENWGQLNDFEEDKDWGGKWRSQRRGNVENQLPTIPEEEDGNENGLGAVISNDFGSDGGRTKLPEQQEPSTDEKALENVDLGGRGRPHGGFGRSSWGGTS